MKAPKPLFDKIATLKNLPTLPHILLKLFESCSRDSVDLVEIAAIVSKDPSLSAKILKLVNSAYFGLSSKVQDINQAVVLVGTSGIKNMAICACVYEAFPKPKKNGNFNLKMFWWHSLRCAFLSKHIASEMNSGQADEAFVAGLLHDIGKVVLWVNFDSAYEALLEKCRVDGQPLIEEEARLGATHCEVAAWLLDRWKFQPVISDAVRYHHESPARIAQALPMVQIVSVANLLCQDTDTGMNQGLVLARKMLGLRSDECHAYIEKSGQEAEEVADALGIDIHLDEATQQAMDEKDQQVQDALVQNVRNVSLLAGSLEGFLTTKDQHDILSVISDGLDILLDIDRFLYFQLDAEKGVLYGYPKDTEGQYTKNHGLAVSMGLDQCLLVQALLKRKPVNSFETAEQRPLTILDEQIVRLLGGQGIYCLPLIAHGDEVGVLVLSLQTNQLPHLVERRKLLDLFIHKGALTLRLDHLKQVQLQAIQAERVEASSDLARRVVHEVNNPLGIIKNYLKILEIKLAGKDIALDEIGIINEEISRVADLLSKLTDFSKEKISAREKADINALLMDIVTLTRESFLRQADVKLHTDLDKDLPPIIAEKAGLKQVFINLIKNAVEAMKAGGNLFIRTRHLPPPISGTSERGMKDLHGSVEVQFQDDGPGIPEAIKEKLFDPYVSTKGGGHSGLGLSIAYNIIKSLHGRIVCERVADQGTIFKIELPIQGVYKRQK